MEMYSPHWSPSSSEILPQPSFWFMMRREWAARHPAHDTHTSAMMIVCKSLYLYIWSSTFHYDNWTAKHRLQFLQIRHKRCTPRLHASKTKRETLVSNNEENYSTSIVYKSLELWSPLSTALIQIRGVTLLTIYELVMHTAPLSSTIIIIFA